GWRPCRCSPTGGCCAGRCGGSDASSEFQVLRGRDRARWTSEPGTWNERRKGDEGMTRARSAPSIGQVLLFGALAIYLLVPMLSVLLYSLATSWTAHILPDGYPLHHWTSWPGDPRLLASIGRSLGLGTAVAVLDVALV